MLPEQSQPMLVIAGIPMTFEEYSTAQKNVQKISPLFWIAWPITAAALGIIALALIAESAAAASAPLMYFCVVFGAVSSIVSAVASRKREREALGTAYAVHRSMRGDGLGQIRFYEDHIESISGGHRLAFPYTAVAAFYEDRHQFVLYTDCVMIVLSARGLTGPQTQELRWIVSCGIPQGRTTVKEPLCPMLAEPIAVPDFPDYPVVPPMAFHNPPLRLEEKRVRAELSQLAVMFYTPLAYVAGVLTALAMDPAGAFPFAVWLCVLAWWIFGQLALTLAARAVAKAAPKTVLGLSPKNGGVTVYLNCGEMFVPREHIAARDAGDGLMVQTPIAPLYLRYADLPDPEAVKRYFGA